MTGPRVEIPIGRPLSPDEWDKQRPSGLTRELSPDEWDQARGMSAQALQTWKLPGLQKVHPDAIAAQRDATATGLDQRTKGKRIGGVTGAILRQVIDPMLENPFTTIGTTAALASPAGTVVGLAMAGQMTFQIAQYGYQKFLETRATPDARRELEADPERLSGEAAAVQAAMLGIGPLIHVGVRSFRGLTDMGTGMMEAGAAGAKELRPPEFSRGALDRSAYEAQRLVEDQADLKATPLSSLLTEEPPARPGRRPQKEALAPSVADYQARRLAEDQADLSASRAADAERAQKGPRRRAKGPGPFFESPQGAETLGAVAARHGLPDDANPYHPSTGLAEDWSAGHAAATESFRNMSETGFASIPGDEPSSVLLPAEGAGRAGSTVNAVARAKELVGPDRLREMAAAEWRRRGAPNTPESHMAAMEQVAREIASRTPVTDWPEGLPKPDRVYHGTQSVFDNFDDAVAAKPGQNLYGPGHYFTDNPAVASEFAEGDRVRVAAVSNVRMARLDIKRPFDIDAPLPKSSVASLKAATTRVVEGIKAGGKESPDVNLAGLDDVRTGDEAYNWLTHEFMRTSRRDPETLVNQVLQEAGFDGITHKGGGKVGNIPHRVWIAFKGEQVRAPFEESAPSYPEGFAMGGPEGRIPGASEVPRRAKGADVPEGATPETAQLAAALKPSRFRGHSEEQLAEAALDAQRALEDAQAAQEHARTGILTSERAQADMENRGVSYSDEAEGTSKVADRQVAAAKTRLAQIEREFTLRGVAGDALAEVIQAAKEARLEREGMSNEAALAQATEDFFGSGPGEDPRRAPVLPVEGTGTVRSRGLSASVARKAVANKLDLGLYDVPEYRQLSMADQSARAVALLEADPALARRVALGEAPAPEGLLPESVFVAVENAAIESGDVATIRDLATQSELTAEATTMGQRIRALGERDPESPVAAIQEVVTVRMGGAKNVPQATAETIAAIRAQLAKSSISREAWASFIDSLRC
jgi:hypothetical protein